MIAPSGVLGGPSRARPPRCTVPGHEPLPGVLQSSHASPHCIVISKEKRKNHLFTDSRASRASRTSTTTSSTSSASSTGSASATSATGATSTTSTASTTSTTSTSGTTVLLALLVPVVLLVTC